MERRVRSREKKKRSVSQGTKRNANEANEEKEVVGRGKGK